MSEEDTTSAAKTRPPAPPAPGDKKLGRVAIKRVPVSRAEAQRAAAKKNPMNQLVPYLDLFSRLDDAQLARLSGAAPEVVVQLRQQVAEVKGALAPFVDLLPRLSDDELARLTGASAKTVRFWRLCRPKLDDAPVDGPRPGVQPGATPSKRPTPIPASATVDGITGDVFPGFEAGTVRQDAGAEELGDIEIGMFMEDEDDLDLEDDDEFL